MTYQSEYLKYGKYYFSGVGGVSMSAIAKYLLALGKTVVGSDISLSKQTEELENLGVKIDYTQRGEFLDQTCAFVYSSAISADNPEMLKALSLGVPIIKRSEILGAITSRFPVSVAVSGSHGKTTTTAMIGDILLAYKLSPTVFLGGESVNYGNFCYGKGDLALIEACEYKRNFLDIKPKIAVVLNIDNDHLDSYADLNEEISVFEKFINGSLAVINADDKRSKILRSNATVTFGIENLANFTAKRICEKEKGISFTAYNSSISLGRINLKIKGRHNVYNALCAIAVADILKVPFKYIKKGLENFYGVKRRNESLFKSDFLEILADYAHHPSEIDALFETYKRELDNILFVFQPHTYSRTEILMDEFVSTLKKCTNLAIYKTYPAREKYSYNGSSAKLFCNLNKRGIKYLKFFGDEESLKKSLVSESKKFSKIIFVGAGDIYNIALKTADLIKLSFKG